MGRDINGNQSSHQITYVTQELLRIRRNEVDEGQEDV